MKTSPVGPDVGLEGADYWSHGIGDYPKCNADVYARIEVRNNTVDKVFVVDPPPDSESWSFLEKWGLIDAK